jgi:hypothetical protein
MQNPGFNGFAGAGKTAEAVEFPSATSHPAEAIGIYTS